MTNDSIQHDAATNATGSRDLVAGLADAGVSIAFISPGSRNTPLTLALAAEPRIEDISIRDERSAGFMALGWAKASGSPAIVVCTSGTAATHYYPAVVEADQSGTPMVVLTADRPIALRGTSAPQTMDQSDLYGRHVKASTDIDILGEELRSIGVATVATARDGIPGPVHLNIPFDEPLTPPSLVPSASPEPIEPEKRDLPPAPWGAELFGGKRLIIIAGGGQPIGFVDALGRYADALGAPILADPQCRPAAHTTIITSDVLSGAGALDQLRPDVVLRLGPLPTSKAITTWLGEFDGTQVVVNRSRLADPVSTPAHAPRHVIDIAPIDFVTASPDVVADPTYLAAWKAADAAATRAIEATLNSSVLSEPHVARSVMTSAQPSSIVFAASSMPIRDVDRFSAPRHGVRVVANRGVNGIDGSISTAIGCAMTGTPTTALIGDIAALHDVAALSELGRLGAPLQVVVINNDGGGIFSFLPQKRSDVIPDEIYERHWGTPHGISLIPIAGAFELTARSVVDAEELSESLSSREPTLIEVGTDRAANVDLHDRVTDAVAKALSLLS
ncbi:MAG: 2-succinyl-5-enolpyruvyl-6-hydroxy-3-cyclohexene-1-carboxylic-acid synthase [Acidimicrobiia bacterium]|nr:2-succinyl-5-enolpyruvyl-6-hydroxy-3-cyclohexene-1-carboxylic-acid synthase [Acidimicrobiia bacterium]